jgi:hypothetical protein
MFRPTEELVKIRRARKVWECRRCVVDIRPGEIHVEDLRNEPSYSSGDRYCLECAEHMGLIKQQGADLG